MNGFEQRGSLVWLAVVTLFALHFVLHIGLSYGREAPDLLTLGVLIAVRETSLGRASALGLVTGLLEDAMSLLAFGTNSIAMTVVAIGGSITRDLFVLREDAVYSLTFCLSLRLYFLFYMWPIQLL